MENSVSNPLSIGNSGTNCAMISNKHSKRHAISSGSKYFARQSSGRISLFGGGKLRKGSGCQIALFLLKVAALESVRRISKSRCPPVWSSLQALQVICYPPFKWIQKWAPFGMLVKGMQMLSRPLLVLSIATAFSDNPECSNSTTESNEVDHGNDDSYGVCEIQPELSSMQPLASASAEDDLPVLPASWLSQLHKELEEQGITLRDRISEEDIHRFYIAADGDFSRLLSSIKKTIQWRETYIILSWQELEMWSSLVFWHGFDVKQKPLLIVRLGLACGSLPFRDRQRFGQAIVSQVYHGIMHLVNRDNPQITVLVDCEGLSPFRLPMQMLKTCSTLLQTHFPNSLGSLFVIRLPSIVRVFAQTFLQVLKPTTRQKLRFLGETYQKVLLSECTEKLPSYLGGSCKCSRCDIGSVHVEDEDDSETRDTSDSDMNNEEEEDIPSSLLGDRIDNVSYDHQVLRMAMLGFLIFGVLLYLFNYYYYISGTYSPESSPVVPL
ncbi:unnamed protein product [Cuscuta epithymum]|uniref:CRAL-TRIO domain-containing protein n=1 Tax=Cuscuta epithymum TaxID=186058 RepID=A0AAV0DSU9_9ASTE|nr:unnamed protein product [Cuscuta epithymum]CAH9143555.1 unnamed protein product [Cuscuta epithymum]